MTVRFEDLADQIWFVVLRWPRIAQNTLGEQLLKAADSVASNIIEGGKKESDADALRFFSIANGSAGEACYWLRRAIRRKLLAEPEGNRIIAEWTTATKLLAGLINYRRSTRWKVREPVSAYLERSVPEAQANGPGARSPKPKASSLKPKEEAARAEVRAAELMNPRRAEDLLPPPSQQSSR